VDKAPNNKFPLTLKPDCSVYTKDKHVGKNHLDLSRVDFIIEFKGSDDPFDDPKSKPKSMEELNLKLQSGGESNPKLQSGEEPSPKHKSRNKNPFLCKEGPQRDYLGQITAYASSILSAQYRTHMFMVLMFKDYARLLRWDCGGAVVTKPIEFNVEPHLFDFLIRYNIADPDVRGHDSTVNSPNDDEIKLAKAAVPELGEAKSFLVVEISDRHYIICGPESWPAIPVGRWTRSSFAYGVNEKR
jgi:hypothetical protein